MLRTTLTHFDLIVCSLRRAQITPVHVTVIHDIAVGSNGGTTDAGGPRDAKTGVHAATGKAQQALDAAGITGVDCVKVVRLAGIAAAPPPPSLHEYVVQAANKFNERKKQQTKRIRDGTRKTETDGTNDRVVVYGRKRGTGDDVAGAIFSSAESQCAFAPIGFNNSRFDNYAFCDVASNLGLLQNVFMADGSILYCV